MTERIVIAEDDEDLAFVLREALRRQRYEIDVSPTAGGLLDRLKTNPYDLILLDVRLPDMDGLDAIPKCRELAPDTPIIVMTAHGTRETAMDAITRGAYDFFTKPLKMDEFQVVVSRALDRRHLQKQVKALRESQPGGLEGLIGQSEVLKRVVEMAHRAAPTDLTVLIRGPSGTGKELVANAIHYRSPRRTRPLVKVNCAAFSRELVESELFGHERGAFTGATATREGKFEVANGGTLLLDEIGDMPPETQAKILRVLQEKELERVGGNRTIAVDVRVLAATNQDLEARVREGTFRQDLYYRLNVVSVVLPPLRERPGDLPPLIEHFLAEAAKRLGRPATALAPEAYRALLAHDWPGNVRELEHALEQAVALASGGEIRTEDLPAAVRGGGDAEPDPVLRGSFKDAKQLVIERFERRFITEALAKHQGNVSKAAEDMGMYRQHLQLKLAEYGIDAEPFRGRRGER